MYGQTDEQEKQKKKIILVSLIMGIIIIILIGVLISAITSKNKLAKSGTETALIREDEQSQPTKIEDNTKSDNAAEDTKLDPVANDDADKSEDAAVVPSSDVKAEATNLPQTGASSVLGFALLAGSATTYAFSKRKN